jgi:hypothetical protein
MINTAELRRHFLYVLWPLNVRRNDQQGIKIIASRALIFISVVFSWFFLLSANGAGLLSQTISVEKVAAEREGLPTDEIERRGRELRKAFDKRYDSLPRPLKLDRFGGVDASDVIQNYIRPGMAFDDAEAILRSAGFSVRARPNEIEAANINRPRDWFAVNANISFFRKSLFRRVDLSATLLPRSPGDYSVVTKSSAVFFFSFP